MIKKFIHQFASPKTYLYQVNRFYPYIFYSSLLIYAISLIWGLFFTPEDFVQGNSYRIIYLHVPASFLSQSLYLAMAVASVTYLVWRVKLAAYLIIAIAPIGAMTTFIALISGSISLHNSFSNFEKADKLTSWLVIIGAVNIPIIKKSVDWWSTLHQSASITLTEKPTIDVLMLYPLIGSMIGFLGLITCLVLTSSKYQILIREKTKSWIQDYV